MGRSVPVHLAGQFAVANRRSRSKPAGSSRSCRASSSASPRIAGHGAVGDDPAGGEHDRARAQRGGEREVVRDDEHRRRRPRRAPRAARAARADRGWPTARRARAATGASRAPSRSPRAGAGRATAGAARGRRRAPSGRLPAPRRRARSASARDRPRFSGPNATSSRTVGMNSWSSGSWKTSPTRARSSRASPLAHPQARDRQRARAGQQAVQVQHQRRLAGAVGAQHRDALAVRHGEVDAVQADHAVRIPVAHVVRLDRAAHAITSAARAPRPAAATSPPRNSDVHPAQAPARPAAASCPP